MNIFLPGDAIKDLEQARDMEPNSLLALYAHANTLQQLGNMRLKPQEGFEELQLACAELESLLLILPTNSLFQEDLALTKLHLALRAEELDFSDEKVVDLKSAADTLYRNLPPESSRAVLARAIYFRYCGRESFLLADYAQSQAAGLNHNHQAIEVAVGLSMLDRPQIQRAVEILNNAPLTFRDSVLAMQMYARIGDIQSKKELEKEYRKLQNSRESTPSVLRLFDWTIVRLLGDRSAHSTELNDASKGLESLGIATGNACWVQQAKFMQGTISEEEMIDSAKDRFDLAYCHFYAAFDALGQADFENAKFHFQKVLATNKFQIHAYSWSTVLLKRIEDPGALRWLRHEEG